MKYLVFALFLAARSEASVCNQTVYDAIYENIIQQALAERVFERAIKNKNNTIETLRALCRGQLSTFERCNPLNGVGNGVRPHIPEGCTRRTK